MFGNTACLPPYKPSWGVFDKQLNPRTPPFASLLILKSRGASFPLMQSSPVSTTRVDCVCDTFWCFFVDRVLQMGRLAQQAGVQVLIRGTSTLRNLENYHKLMGKKQGTYLKSYGAFMKVGVFGEVFPLMFFSLWGVDAANHPQSIACSNSSRRAAERTQKTSRKTMFRTSLPPHRDHAMHFGNVFQCASRGWTYFCRRYGPYLFLSFSLSFSLSVPLLAARQCRPGSGLRPGYLRRPTRSRFIAG